MDNIDLFEYSLKNIEQIFDAANKKEKLVITKSSKKKNEPIRNNESLINLITTYHTMYGKLTKIQDDELIGEIDSILFNNEHMNYTAFSQYLMVWDMPYSALRDEKERKQLLRKLIKKYIKDRHQMYTSHGYSNIVLQVLADNYSHKRGGSTGANKIIMFVERAGIKKYHEDNDIDKDSFYLLPDKGGKKYFKDICKEHNINFKWSRSKQGKMPDCYIQKAPNAWIIEHKHKKGGGGGQYSQIVEIVDFLKYTEKNVSYVAFLDGILFNELINASSDTKMSKAKKDIYKYLKINKNNYFVNTAGFSRLLQSI
ncbi:MAG: hypothetical protein FD145_397 [Candidatus Saganbacteria bacterium]|uniref:Restriction endonuclease type II DpnII-like domain-containing protein n=1 Tax=Candidatus Saganbacteria bacterium TaxID=2575572 RepID=A0A833P3H6_UNCSA|nr:MAG: hypothetical protein FD145_397 [Candidatus Saganbacteria bacterium]